MKVLSIDAEIFERPDFLCLCKAANYHEGAKPEVVLFRVLRFYRWAIPRLDKDGVIEAVPPEILHTLLGGTSDFWRSLAHPNVGWVEWLEGGGLKLKQADDLTGMGAMTFEVPSAKDIAKSRGALQDLMNLFRPPSPARSPTEKPEPDADPQRAAGLNPAAPARDGHPGDLSEAAEKVDQVQRDASAVEP